MFTSESLDLRLVWIIARSTRISGKESWMESDLWVIIITTSNLLKGMLWDPQELILLDMPQIYLEVEVVAEVVV